MSTLRESMITAWPLTGALLATPAAALASTIQHAASSATAASASAKVRRALGTGLTFNVDHDHPFNPICYAGTGTISPHVQGVHRITTGEYWGCLRYRAGTALADRSFDPSETVPFPRPVELVSFELARHPAACPL
jgi:hypothetical protein